MLCKNEWFFVIQTLKKRLCLKAGGEKKELLVAVILIKERQQQHSHLLPLECQTVLMAQFMHFFPVALTESGSKQPRVGRRSILEGFKEFLHLLTDAFIGIICPVEHLLNLFRIPQCQQNMLRHNAGGFELEDLLPNLVGERQAVRRLQPTHVNFIIIHLPHSPFPFPL